MTRFATWLAIFSLWATAAAADPLSIALTFAMAGIPSALGFAGLKVLVGLGLSALGRKLMPKPEAPEQPGIKTDSTTQGESTPQRFIVGRYSTEGHLAAPAYVFQNDSDPNEWLTYIIELSDLPINALRKVWVDGDELEWEDGTVGDPTYNLTDTHLGATFKGKYNDRVFVRLHKGTQTTPDAFLRHSFGTYPDRPWTASMVLRGVAYAVVTFKGRMEDKVFQGGFPAVRFEIDGISMLDPRTGLTNFTQNPMVMAWNIVRGITMNSGDVWGYNVPVARILSSTAYAAMNACDETVPVQGGGSEVRYQAGFEISVDEEPANVLAKILEACHGDFADMGGEIILSAGAPSGSVYSFTDKDILSTVEESSKPFPGLDELVNAVHASFPDPSKNWEPKEAAPLYNAAFEAEDGGRRLLAELTFNSVSRESQVRRLMREMLSDHRRQRNHVVTLPPDAAGVKLLDTVTWTSAHHMYSNKLFEVRQKAVDPWSGCVTLQLRERDPSDYNPSASGDAVRPVVGPNTPVDRDIVGVPDFSFVKAIHTGADGRQRAGGRFWWPTNLSCDSLTWEIERVGDGGDLVENGSTQNIARGTVFIELLPATQYRGRIKQVIGKRSTTWTNWVTITTDATLIGANDIDVQGITADIQNDINDLETWATGTDTIIGDLRDELDQAKLDLIDYRDEAQNDIAQARTDLGLLIDDVEQLAIDNLNLAKDYTDTSILTESAARVTATDALAAQIQTLTAVLNSENYIENPRFSDGLTGWSGNTGNTTVVAQDTGSSDPIVAGSPAAHFASMATDTSAARGLRQFLPIEWIEGEEFQWRLYLASASARSDVEITLRWRDSGGAQIGATVTNNTSLPANTWKVFSGRHAPPVGATQVRFDVRVPPTGTTAPAVAFTDVSVTKVDVSVIARVTALEVAFASDEDALALFKQSAEARMDDTEAAVTAEALARANGDTALAGRIDTVEVSANATRTYRGNTAPATPKIGDLWIDTADGRKLKRWNGSTWQDADDTRIAQNTAAISNEVTARADADIALAGQISNLSTVANNKNKTYRQNTAPTGDLVVGDIWIDTSAAGKNMIKRWNGTTWQNSGDTRIDANIVAISNEVTARSNADSALGLRIDAIEVVSGDNTAAIISEETARVNADEALAGRIDTVEVTVGDNTSAISNEAIARADADTALAGQISRVSARTAEGTSRNPTFDNWDTGAEFPTGYTGWVGTGNVLSKTAANWQNKYTQAVLMESANTNNNGPQLRMSSLDHGQASNNPAAVLVTAELFRSSGGLSGAFVRAIWIGNNTVEVVYPLQGKLPYRSSTEVTFFADRPADFSPGSSPEFRIEVYATSNLISGESRSVGVLVVHRLDYIEVTTDSAVARWSRTEAAVATEAIARVNADEALGGLITTVEAKADAARTFRQSTPPENPKNGDLWFDTSDNRKLKRWNGTSWVGSEDLRIATNESAIANEALARADADGAIADNLLLVSARTDRASASGLLRITSTAAPTGAQSRIALRAEATASDESHSAAMFLDARTDGTSQAGFVADRFFIASDTGSGASRAVPFIVDGGVVYIDVARIREATIGTLHMASGSMVSGYTTTFSFSGDLDTAIINVPAYSSQSALMVMAQGTLISPNNDNTLCYMFVELNGASRKPIWSTLSVSGPLGIRTHYFSAFCVYSANTGVNQIKLSHQSASSVTGTLTVLELKKAS